MADSTNVTPDPESSPGAERQPIADPVPGPLGVLPGTLQENLLGAIARTVTLAGLIAAGVTATAQLTAGKAWVPGFIRENDLGMAARMLFLGSLGVSLLLGAAIAAGLLLWGRRRNWGATWLEPWCWWLSPLIVAAVFPIFLRFTPWQDRHADLLLCVAGTLFPLEFLLRRSFGAVPAPVSRVTARIVQLLGAFLRRRGPLLLVLAGSLAYAIFMSFYMVRWHHKLRTHAFDLGINANLMSGGLVGKFLHSTIVMPEDPSRYINNHAKIGGYGFLPIYALFPRAETLLIIESTLLGLGALPLFAFARRRMGELSAAFLALAYLCYHPMHGANFYEVNHVPMACPFIFATLWAADTRRWGWFTFFAIWGGLMREDVPVGLAIVGTVLVLSGHRPKQGLVLALVSTAWFGFLRFYVMNQAGEWWFPNMYRELWAPGQTGFVSVIKTLVSNPVFTLAKVSGRTQLLYLLHLLVPLAFVPTRRWWAFAGFIPGALFTLLGTKYAPLTMYSFQYTMHWTPYLFVGAALVLSAIEREEGSARMRAALTTVCVASLFMTYQLGAFPRRDTMRGGYDHIDFTYSAEERERYAALREVISHMRKGASVTATENIAPHVADHVYLYAMRQGTYGCEYLLASSRELRLQRTKPSLGEALRGKGYGLVFQKADFALFQRGADPSKNAKIISEWAL